MIKTKKKFSDVSSAIGLLAIIILVLVFYFLNPNFLKLSSITNILTDMSPLLIMAVGVTFIIIMGSTDLSIGAVCSLASVLFVRYSEALGAWSYALVIAFGMICGLCVGVLHAKFKIPSFIASLGVMSICESLALVFSNSATIQLKPKYWYTVDWMSYKIGIVPVVFLFALAVAFLYLFIQNKTRFGKYVYAIGTNERASWMVGVRTSRMKIMCFTAAGACYALGGVMFVSKMVSGGPNVGDSYTLLTIAAVALGGNSMAGGKGSIIKTIIGVTIATIVRNGMTIVGVDSFWQKIVFGSIIVIAAFLTSDHSNKEQVVK